MTLARVITATTGLVSAQKIVRREEGSGQAPAPVASASAASVREYFFKMNEWKIENLFSFKDVWRGDQYEWNLLPEPGLSFNFWQVSDTFYTLQIQFTVSEVSSDFRDWRVWIYDPIYTFSKLRPNTKLGVLTLDTLSEYFIYISHTWSQKRFQLLWKMYPIILETMLLEFDHGPL